MKQRRVSRPPALLAGTLALLLAGCATETNFEYPEFEQWSTSDAPGDCASVELELRRVDAVRWSMREDGLDLADDRSRASRSIFWLLGGAASMVVAPSMVGAFGHSGIDAYAHGPEHTLEQADRRLVRLLQRKRELGCPPLPTHHSATNDMALLDKIEELNRRRKSGEISDRKEAELRSRLMDDLHASGHGK